MVKEKIKKIAGKLFGSALYRTVCVLLLLTMLTAWSVTGVYAKYITSGSAGDSSTVAGMGILKFEVTEHEPTIDLKDMVKNNTLHKLDTTKEISSTSTTYWHVPPGVDIPKDTFVSMHIKAEVNYELYVQIDKSDKFPDETVTFELADGWTEVEGQEGLYKYNVIFEAGKEYGTNSASYTVQILKDNMIYVSENYIGGDFSITFSACLKQTLKAPAPATTQP